MKIISDNFTDLSQWNNAALESAVATGYKMKTLGSNSTWGQAFLEASILQGFTDPIAGDFDISVTLEWDGLDGGGNVKYHEFYLILGNNVNESTGWRIIAGIQEYGTGNPFFTANINGSYINCDAYNYGIYDSNAPVHIRITRESGYVTIFEKSARTSNEWLSVKYGFYNDVISKVVLSNTTSQASGDPGGPNCRAYTLWSNFSFSYDVTDLMKMPKTWYIMLHQTATPLVQATVLSNWLTPYTNSSGDFTFQFVTPVENTNWEQRNYGSGWGNGPWPKQARYVSLFRPESPFQTAVYAGGSIYGSASVCYTGIETDQVMGLRILHEMLHSAGVDSDQMCAGDREAFGDYLVSIGHPDAGEFIANATAFQHDPDMQAVYYQWLMDTEFYTDYFINEIVEVIEPAMVNFSFTAILEHIHLSDSLNTWLAQHFDALETISIVDSPAIRWWWNVVTESIEVVDTMTRSVHMRIVKEIIEVKDTSAGFLSYVVNEILELVDQMIPAHVAEEKVGVRSGDDPLQAAGHDEFGNALFDMLDEFGNAIYDRLTEVGRYVINKVSRKTNTEVEVIEQVAICEETVIVQCFGEEDT